MFTKRNVFYSKATKNGEAIFDVSIHSSDDRLTYVKKFTGKASELVVAKNDLLHYRRSGQMILVSLLLLVSILPVFLLSVFSAKKEKYPLMIIELVECFNLQLVLKAHQITTVYYFCIFERDANLCAFILMKQGIIVVKIPSEVPLHFLNQVIVADQVNFCFAYQKEEFEAYRGTMFVQRTELWGPEQILNVPQRFLIPRDVITPTYQIGFFSSGIWLREKKGDIDSGNNDRENEELILHALVKYTKMNNITLRLFLHPHEKQDENRADMIAYYAQFLNQSKNISIADLDKNSREGFDDIDIGVSLYSTLMFERIYLGFKTILAPFDYAGFPLKNSPFKNICAYSVNELSDKLNASLPLTNKEFFEKFDLKTYTNYLA